MFQAELKTNLCACNKDIYYCQRGALNSIRDKKHDTIYSSHYVTIFSFSLMYKSFSLILFSHFRNVSFKYFYTRMYYFVFSFICFRCTFIYMYVFICVLFLLLWVRDVWSSFVYHEVMYFIVMFVIYVCNNYFTCPISSFKY